MAASYCDGYFVAARSTNHQVCCTAWYPASQIIHRDQSATQKDLSPPNLTSAAKALLDPTLRKLSLKHQTSLRYADPSTSYDDVIRPDV